MTLEIDKISKKFHGKTLLNELSLRLDKGEIISLLGPSGVGKTTLLRILIGIEQPDSGQISLEGENLLCQAPHKRALGIVFQNYALFQHMSVAKNIDFALRLRRPKFSREERHERFYQLSELCQLEKHFWSLYPQQLSGGQQQRVALARTLASEPKVLLLDEPFSALDSRLRRETRKQLHQLLKESGVGSLLVTHDQKEACLMGDRVAILLDGCIAQIDSPQQLYKKVNSEKVAHFLGSEESSSP